MGQALVTCLLLLCGLASSAYAQVSFTAFPADYQLIPREGDARTATYRVRGTVTGVATGRRLSAKLTQRGKTVDSSSVALAYVNGVATFDLPVAIPVTRANHTLQVTVDGAIRATARYLVAGDVYMVNGQSNAEGLVVMREADRDSFLRGPRYLGTGWAPMQLTRAGLWMGRTANELSRQRDVPVAAFNFAVGAKGIEFFREGHEARDGNFEAARDTLRKYDVDQRVRGLIWFQGETDAFSYSAERYRAELDSLLSEYEAAFGIPRFYAFQTRTFSCSSTRPDVMEGQRQLSAERADFDLMSTMNAMHLTDGCHYFADGGYDVLGTRMARLILYREGGSRGSAQVLPPDVDSARVTGPREISVWFDTHGAGLAVSGNPYPEFRAEGTGYRPTGGRVDGDRLVLTFAEAVAGSTGISYLSHSGPAPDYVYSASGPGVLTFHDLSFVRGDGDVGNFADVRLTLGSEAQTLRLNGQLAVRLTLYNEGPSSVRAAKARIPTPAGLNFVSGQSSVAGTDVAPSLVEVTWTIPKIFPGDSASLLMTYFIREVGGAVTLWAEVASDESRDEDSAPGNGEPGEVREDDEARLVFGDRRKDCVLSAEATAVTCDGGGSGEVLRFFLTGRDATPSLLSTSGTGIPAATWPAGTRQELIVPNFNALIEAATGSLRLTVTKVADATCATRVAVRVPDVCLGPNASSDPAAGPTSLSLYPNPVRSGGLLRLTSPTNVDEGPEAVQIYSATGQRVPTSGAYREDAHTLAVRIEAPAGVYLAIVGVARRVFVVLD